MADKSANPTKSTAGGSSKSAFSTLVISRTHLNDKVEVYLDGECMGVIRCEIRGASTRLYISAVPALRFVKAEYCEKSKAEHIDGARQPGRKA